MSGGPSANALIDALRGQGLRITRPRRAICTALARFRDDHLTAAELKQRAEREVDAAIDLSTIYRTIDALEQADMLHHVHLGHGPSVLHLSDHLDHHHLVCEVCGRTEDLPLEELEPMIVKIEARHGFIADSVHFALVGRCGAHDRSS